MQYRQDNYQSTFIFNVGLAIELGAKYNKKENMLFFFNLSSEISSILHGKQLLLF